jgi:hypothetical protein
MRNTMSAVQSTKRYKSSGRSNTEHGVASANALPTGKRKALTLDLEVRKFPCAYLKVFRDTGVNVMWYNGKNVSLEASFVLMPT